ATLFIDGCCSWQRSGLDSRGSAKDSVVHRGESGSSSAGKKLIPAAALLLMIFSAMNSYDTVASDEGECYFAAVETSSRSSTNCADTTAANHQPVFIRGGCLFRVRPGGEE